MDYAPRRGLRLDVLAIQVVLAPVFAGFAHSQGLQTSPYSAPSMLRGLSEQGLRQAPSDTVSLSSGMFPGILPPIPNLQIGYLYSFGPNVSSGRFTADYLLPFSLSQDSVLFGEAHTEFQSFWNTSGFNNRVDVSLGGGYRTILKESTLIGVNGFSDTTRLGGTWYSSGSVGVEMAALLPGNDSVDINFNWYGRLFDSDVIRNAFRYGPSNFDFQAGYSHELWNGGPDLRLSATGYKFDAGNSVYGWNAGAELKSRDWVFILRYNVGNDKVNRTYQTVGAFVNVGFHLEKALKGQSPFGMPEPIFKSPRNLWYMLTQTPNRNWSQPTQVVLAQANGRRIVCTNLNGYILSIRPIPKSTTILTPGFTQAPTITIELNWCGVTNVSTVSYINIVDSSSTSWPYTPTASFVVTGTGTEQLTYTPFGGPPPDVAAIYFVMDNNIEYEEGGGVSFQFK